MCVHVHIYVCVHVCVHVCVCEHTDPGNRGSESELRKEGWVRVEGVDFPTLETHILCDPEHPVAGVKLKSVKFRCDCSEPESCVPVFSATSHQHLPLG